MDEILNNDGNPIEVTEAEEIKAVETSDQLFEVKESDGTVSKLTWGEAQERLVGINEKVSGADKKFREASDIRKYTEQMGETFRAAQAGDVDSIKQLVNYPELGINQEKVDDIMRQSAPSTEVDGPIDDSRPLRREDLPADVQRELAEGRSARLKSLKAQVYGDLDSSLDLDEVLGHIMGSNEGRSKRVADRVRNHAREVLKRRVAQEAQDGREWKPSKQEYGRIVQEARAFASDFYEDDPSSPEADSVPTIGRAPLLQANALHRKTTPPKRVASTDPGYGKYLAEKVTYDQALES